MPEPVATARSTKPSPLKSPAAIPRASIPEIVCAGPLLTRCATLSAVVVVSFAGVSSIGTGPATATFAFAKTSPAKLPWPVNANVRVMVAATAPSVHDSCVVLPEMLNVQPGSDGGSNWNGTSPANVAVSVTPGTSTVAVLFLIVKVHVSAPPSATGFGVAVSVIARSTRLARSTFRLKLPGTGGAIPSLTVNLTWCGPTSTPSGVPEMAPAALNSKLAGSPLVTAYVRLEAGLSGSVTNCASERLNGTASVAV